MNYKRNHIIVIVFLSVIAGLIGILGNLATATIPDDWRPYLWLAWPLFGILLLASILLTLWQLQIEKSLHRPAMSFGQGVDVPTSLPLANICNKDLANAPDIKSFIGRKEELNELTDWILEDRCRVVGVFGIGGSGKTATVAKLTGDVQSAFDYVFWRSLLNAPLLEDTLRECLQFLSGKPDLEIPPHPDHQISLLLRYMEQQRILLILDNVESILQKESYAGQYVAGYEDYGKLLLRIGESNHRSCLVVNGREQPKELEALQSNVGPIRVMHLEGLKSQDAKALLEEKGIIGDDHLWLHLIDHYSGNPLALKVIGTTIHDLFGGNIENYLKYSELVWGGIQQLLDQQFNRLSLGERAITYWLAINRELTSIDELSDDLLGPTNAQELLASLQSLHHRSLVETDGAARFTLQPVVMEYVTDKLIDDFFSEISEANPKIIFRYPVLKAQAKDFVRVTQERMIVRPLMEKLERNFGNEVTKRLLVGLLASYKNQPSSRQGYLGGNVANLILYLTGDLNSLDFSTMAIWQADFRNAQTHGTDFTQCHFHKSVFTEEFGAVLSLAFSFNGELLAIGTSNGKIYVREVSDGKQILNLSGHTDWVSDVAFHPKCNLLASASYDHTVRIWDIDEGKCNLVLTEHRHRVSAVAFSRNGFMLASGGGDCEILLWEVDSGKHIGSLSGHSNWIRSISFDRTGKLLVSGSEDHTIKLWDVEQRKCLLTVDLDSTRVRAVALNPTGDSIAAGAEDHNVYLWDSTGRKILTLVGHHGRVRSICFNSDGRFLVSGSEDQTLRVWDIQKAQCIQVFLDKGNDVRTVAYNPDDSIIASGGDAQIVRLWSPQTAQCIKTLKGYANPMWSLTYVQHKSSVITAQDDGTVRFWETDSGNCTRVLRGHKGRVSSIASSPQQDVIASGSYDQTIRIWDVESGHCKMIMRGHVNRIRSVNFSPDGKKLVSSSSDHTLRIWDVASGNCINTFEGHSNRVRAAAFSPDGQTIASCSEDHTLMLWDLKSGRNVCTLTGHSDWVLSADWSPDGRWLASSGEDHLLLLWDTQTNECIRILRGHSSRIRSIAYSPDGLKIASASDDGTVKLWNVETGQTLTELRGHEDWVLSVAYSGDGEYIFSCGKDESIRIWSTRDFCCVGVIRAKRPYEGANITLSTGLTDAQRNTLLSLGAFQHDEGVYAN